MSCFDSPSIVVVRLQSFLNSNPLLIFLMIVLTDWSKTTNIESNKILNELNESAQLLVLLSTGFLIKVVTIVATSSVNSIITII